MTKIDLAIIYIFVSPTIQVVLKLFFCNCRGNKEKHVCVERTEKNIVAFSPRRSLNLPGFPSPMIRVLIVNRIRDQ